MSSYTFTINYIWDSECTLAVTGTGGPVKRSVISIYYRGGPHVYHNDDDDDDDDDDADDADADGSDSYQVLILVLHEPQHPGQVPCLVPRPVHPHPPPEQGSPTQGRRLRHRRRRHRRPGEGLHR
eukprot:1164135-Prorocentrum_minimum.AAC.1